MLSSRYVRTGRDVLIIVIVFSVLSAWLSRHLLDRGSETGQYRLPLTAAEGESVPAGQFHHLQWPSGHGGKTLLYFFAPWCGVCRVSMPGLNLFTGDEYRAELDIVAVALDYESAGEVQEFVTDTGFEGKTVLGGEEMKTAFRVTGYPSYYILDSNGRVLHSDRGLTTPPGLWLRANL